MGWREVAGLAPRTNDTPAAKAKRSLYGIAAVLLVLAVAAFFLVPIVGVLLVLAALGTWLYGAYTGGRYS